MQDAADSTLDLLPSPQIDIALAILRFLPWRERGLVLSLNKAWAAEPTSRAYKMFTEELAERYQLYAPMALEDRERTSGEWRALFLQLLPSLHVWSALAPGAAPASHKASMRVCARFRPKRTRENAAGGGEVPPAETRVVLPLHQRLQLIKASHACSSVEAQKLLWAGADATGIENDPFAAPKGDSQVHALPLADLTNADSSGSKGSSGSHDAGSKGGDSDGTGTGTGTDAGSKGRPSASPASAADTGETSLDDIADEQLEGTELSAITAPTISTKAGVVHVGEANVVFCAPSIGLREFRFTGAFGQGTSQAVVYEKSLRPLIVDLLNGRSGCLLCFGQTGSGKTFTMSGPDEQSATSLGQGASPPNGDVRGAPAILEPAAGLVPRALRELIDAVATRKAQHGLSGELRISFVEVYGEDVTDLLKDGEHLGAWRGVAARALASGLADVTIESDTQVSELLLKADRAKRRAATVMNDRSSRAHAILTLSLVQTDASLREVRSTLCLADLGGSEQLKRSKAVGVHMREAVQINLGLLALKQCVTALTQGASYVPYQDSKLTMLLQPGLSGQAQTVVVICASPEAEDAAETVETLRFGENCAVLESSSKPSSASLMAQTLRSLDSEIARVEAEVVAKERWEVVVEHRVDERAEHNQAELERVLVTKLVGAEAERADLEELLARRRELLGA
mmetsp:Transcript_8295/g.21225  ORF Transcript_8295/g.21225 Transcript_8295/m.21225 type:complete len:687 (+) Transcript_8295:46-2106(+)